MRLRRQPADEQGSVLLLILGLVVLAGLFVTIVIDVSALFLQRRELIAAADGAALAGAQAIDEEALYTSGLPEEGALVLDQSRARSAVLDYLTNNGLTNDYPSLEIRVDTTPTTVSVRLSATVRLPVVNTVTPGAEDGVVVESGATARSAVIS
jgi:uncharacterized membrane protein